MNQLIKNGKILSPVPLPENFAILIENDRIAAVDHISKFSSAHHIVDAQGKRIIPGLIDIHVHGAVSADTMDAQDEALGKMAGFFASKGVTSFLPTTVTASRHDIDAAVNCVGSMAQSTHGARILGIHLEGPYLGVEHKGAQPEQHLRSARPEEYLPWLEAGLVRLLTVAPEIEGVITFIEKGTQKGVKFAVGHSSARYEQMVQAIDAGLSQATHTFNGMPSLHHRKPGVVGAVLTDDRVFAQVIADGIHLHPAVVKLIFLAKGVGRTVLITDAIRATGAQDGKHRLGDQLIEVKDGIARTDSGSLAGSTLTMDRALRNACEITGRSMDEMLPAATTIAAESLGMEAEIGALKPGLMADLVFLDENDQPCLTMVGGEVVFQK
jgi:N-acetylglucosamine-6-phosphate deacetylase